jgi:hypothetical protein
MNYNQPEDFEPRETDRRAEEPTHYTNVWNSSMLWEVGLILLVGLVLVFCAWSFGAQGREVAATAQANTDMTWELSVEMIEPSGKTDVDRVPITNSPFDISFGATKQSGIGTEIGRERLEAFAHQDHQHGEVPFGIRQGSYCPSAFASGKYWPSPGEKFARLISRFESADASAPKNCRDDPLTVDEQ